MFLRLTGPENAEWYVPANMRAVVTSVVGVNMGADPGQALVYVTGAYAFFANVPGSTSMVPQAMRVVAYEGERIAGSTTGSAMNMIVTGYLFDDPYGRMTTLPAEKDEPWLPGAPSPLPLPSPSVTPPSG